MCSRVPPTCCAQPTPLAGPHWPSGTYATTHSRDTRLTSGGWEGGCAGPPQTHPQKALRGLERRVGVNVRGGGVEWISQNCTCLRMHGCTERAWPPLPPLASPPPHTHTRTQGGLGEEGAVSRLYRVYNPTRYSVDGRGRGWCVCMYSSIPLAGPHWPSGTYAKRHEIELRWVLVTCLSWAVAPALAVYTCGSAADGCVRPSSNSNARSAAWQLRSCSLAAAAEVHMGRTCQE